MAVEVFPFIYTAVFIFLFAAYSLFSGIVLDLIDYVFFVSPAVVLVHIFYSKMLMMCRWHRIACSIPLVPQAVDLFDSYVYHFERLAWIVVSVTILVSIILFALAVYKVFFTEDGQFCR